MDCPFLKYEDTGWFSWKHTCTAIGQKVGDQDNKLKVENTCKNNQFYNCPYYKKLRG